MLLSFSGLLDTKAGLITYFYPLLPGLITHSFPTSCAPVGQVAGLVPVMLPQKAVSTQVYVHMPLVADAENPAAGGHTAGCVHFPCCNVKPARHACEEPCVL
jgi:hypothetical protein